MRYQAIFRENGKETRLTDWTTLREAMQAKRKALASIKAGFGEACYILAMNPDNRVHAL